MLIPLSSRKKALCVVDVQSAFANKDNYSAVPAIARLLKSVDYDCYIEALFWCDEATLWIRQAHDKPIPRDEDFRTLPEIAELLKGKPLIKIEKLTKSVFRGNLDLDAELRKRGIEEIHFVGYDTDDCVLTSAEDSFDLGYFTYVIEECCASSSGQAFHDHATAILRNVSLTNNSLAEEIPVMEI